MHGPWGVAEIWNFCSHQLVFQKPCNKGDLCITMRHQQILLLCVSTFASISAGLVQKILLLLVIFLSSMCSCLKLSLLHCLVPLSETIPFVCQGDSVWLWGKNIHFLLYDLVSVAGMLGHCSHSSREFYHLSVGRWGKIYIYRSFCKDVAVEKSVKFIYLFIFWNVISLILYKH